MSEPRIESELIPFYRNTTKVELMELARDYAERCLGGAGVYSPGQFPKAMLKELRQMRRRVR